MKKTITLFGLLILFAVIASPLSVNYINLGYIKEEITYIQTMVSEGCFNALPSDDKSSIRARALLESEYSTTNKNIVSELFIEHIPEKEDRNTCWYFKYNITETEVNINYIDKHIVNRLNNESYNLQTGKWGYGDLYYCEDSGREQSCDRLSQYYSLPNGKCWNSELGNRLCKTGWILK